MGLDVGKDDTYILAIYCASANRPGMRQGDIMFYCTRDAHAEPVAGTYTWTIEGRLRIYYSPRAFNSGDKKQWATWEADATEEAMLDQFWKFCHNLTSEYNKRPYEEVEHEEMLFQCAGQEATRKFSGYADVSRFMHAKAMTPEEALRDGYITQAEYDQRVGRTGREGDD